MNTNERDALRAALDAYKRFDLTAAIARAYPDQPDLSTYLIGAFSAENLVLYANQMVDNFNEVIAKGLWVSVPGHSIEGQRRVNHIAAMQQFLAAVEQSALEQVSTLLAQLISYQMDHGFWRLPGSEVLPPDAAELKQLSDMIKVQTKRLEEAQGHLVELLSRIDTERAGLNSFSNEKKAEFEELRKMVAESKQHLNTITTTQEEAKKKEATIGAIEASGKKVVEGLNVELGVVKKELDAFKSSAGEAQEKLSTDTANARRSLDASEKLYKFIKGKEQEIIKLLGMAADAALGTKYDSRGSQIGKGLRFWQWAVPLSVLIAVVWVIVVFTCLKTDDLNEWINLVINLLKTSPAFVLMGFVFAQYGKERNLQEEWMFKAAVAMTINAYADLLEDKDKESNMSRQQLILNALRQVHTPPKLHNEKGGSLFSWRAKDLKSSLDQLTESIKGIKDAAKP